MQVINHTCTSYSQFCHKHYRILRPVFNKKSYCIFYFTCDTSASCRSHETKRYSLGLNNITCISKISVSHLQSCNRHYLGFGSDLDGQSTASAIMTVFAWESDGKSFSNVCIIKNIHCVWQIYTKFCICIKKTYNLYNVYKLQRGHQQGRA